MADSWCYLLFQPTIAEIEKTMFDRGNEIQRIKENMNNVEDKVFANFCEQIGVANIRQYEERELRYSLWLQYLLLLKTVCFLNTMKEQHYLDCACMMFAQCIARFVEVHVNHLKLNELWSWSVLLKTTLHAT